MKKIKQNNKGFTLVELLITLGILSIVMVMVGAIIGMSSGTYKNISNDLNLQYESQLAMSQIQEYVIDCNAYVASVDDAVNDTLYLYNARTDGEDTVYDGYKFALDGNTMMLYTNYNLTETTFSGFTNEQPMSRNVTNFTAELNGNSVKVTLEYELGRETYMGVQTIAFRNPVGIL